VDWSRLRESQHWASGGADADLAKALEIAPADPQANHLRAMVEQRLGRIDDAVSRLARWSMGVRRSRPRQR